MFCRVDILVSISICLVNVYIRLLNYQSCWGSIFIIILLYEYFGSKLISWKLLISDSVVDWSVNWISLQLVPMFTFQVLGFVARCKFACFHLDGSSRFEILPFYEFLWVLSRIIIDELILLLVGQFRIRFIIDRVTKKGIILLSR